MAVSVNWATKVIYIPKSDLTLVQSFPLEIRELDLNWFRLQLKDLEDSEDGIWADDTHRHNTEVSLGGLTFARVIEIINDYTITFEDGQYAINLVGANSNVGDRVNVNQVSVRSSNSAGLISNPAIEYASFNGGVSVNLSSNYSGTVYPVGTQRMPVNNFDDALLISEFRGFSTLFVYGDSVINDSDDFESYIFIGESQTKTHIHINSIANVRGCEFYDFTITGVLDGNTKIKDCFIGNLSYINGVVQQCLLGPGLIELGGDANAHFIDCWSGVPGFENPIIDMGGSGQNLSLRNYNGGVTIRNMDGASNFAIIDLNSGHVVIEDTVVSGTIVVRGIGSLEDYSGPNVLLSTEALVSVPIITNGILDATIDSNTHNNSGTFGEIINSVNSKLPEGSIASQGEYTDTLLRVLGLLQENQYLDQTVYATYNGQKLLTSGRIRIYSSAASVGTNNNVIASYRITTSWSNDEMTSYKVERL